MKKIIAGALILFSSLSYAAPLPIDQKILNLFKEAFPKAIDVKWYESKDYNEVFFRSDDVVCRIRYNEDGDITYARRDYYENMLCPFIKAKVLKRFPDKKIYGITEITSDEGISYSIILQDDKNLVYVNSNAVGEMKVTQKMKKANQ